MLAFPSEFEQLTFSMLKLSQLFGAAPYPLEISSHPMQNTTRDKMKELVLRFSLLVWRFALFFMLCWNVHEFVAQFDGWQLSFFSKFLYSVVHTIHVVVLAVIFFFSHRKVGTFYRNLVPKVERILDELKFHGINVNSRKRMTVHCRFVMVMVILIVSFSSVDYFSRSSTWMWFMSFAAFLLPYWVTILYLLQYFYAMGISCQIFRSIQRMIKYHSLTHSTDYPIERDMRFNLEFLRKATYSVTLLVQDATDTFGFILLAEALDILVNMAVALFEFHQFYNVNVIKIEDALYLVCSVIWIFMQTYLLLLILLPQSAVNYEVCLFFLRSRQINCFFFLDPR